MIKCVYLCNRKQEKQKEIKMKNLLKIFFLMFIATSLVFGTTSCKKDDEAPTHKAEKADASVVEGTYMGLLTMYLQEMPAFELPSIPAAKFVLRAENGGTVAIAIPSIEYDLNGRIMVLPSVEQGGIVVEKNGEGNYTLAETTISQTVNDKSYTGSIMGSVVDGVLTLNFSMRYGNMPMTLVFTFVSSKELAAAPAYAVASNYTGSISMSVEGSSTPFEPMENAVVGVVANGDSLVTITLPDVVYRMGSNERTMTGFSVSGVKVTGNKVEGFQLLETEINETVGQSEYVGTISGNVTDGLLHLNYVVKPGAMPMNIVFVFDTYQD